MRSTFFKALLIPAVAAVAAFVSQPAQAAQSQTIKVPFAFTAMGKTFPAGNYIVEENVNTNVVTLKNGKKSLASILVPGDPAPFEERVVLRFATAGDQHVLDTIQYGAKITTRMTHLDSRTREEFPRSSNGQ